MGITLCLEFLKSFEYFFFVDGNIIHINYDHAFARKQNC